MLDSGSCDSQPRTFMVVPIFLWHRCGPRWVRPLNARLTPNVRKRLAESARLVTEVRKGAGGGEKSGGAGNLAERERFELSRPLRAYGISSAAPSTELGDRSAGQSTQHPRNDRPPAGHLGRPRCTCPSSPRTARARPRRRSASTASPPRPDRRCRLRT